MKWNMLRLIVCISLVVTLALPLTFLLPESTSAVNAPPSPRIPVALNLSGGGGGGSYWHTFLGGVGHDYGSDITLDVSGNSYVAGTSNNWTADWGAPLSAYTGGVGNAYVAKLNSSGNVTWYTFLGGAGGSGGGIARDDSGNIFITGTSYQTWGAPLRAYTGGGDGADAFVAKLDSSGSLVWNTFLGGTVSDRGYEIAVDGSDNIYVAGISDWTWGAPLRGHSGGWDNFVAKLDNSGSLSWHIFLGASGNEGTLGSGIALDGGGNVYAAGTSANTWGSPVRAKSANSDAFAAKLDGSGNITWNTFLGDSGWDNGLAVTVDGAGAVYVAGYSTATWGSPARAYTAGTSDAFVAKLDSSGNLTMNTFLGGTGQEFGRDIAVAGSGNIYVTGWSNTAWGCPVRAFAGGDAFVARLTSSGNLTWSTFLGGSAADDGYGIVLDGSQNVYVKGVSPATWGSPVHAYSGQNDAFVAKLNSSGSLTGSAPNMGVAGNDTYIANEDSEPSVDDHTDFGNVDVDGGTVVRTFTIMNAGLDSLSLCGSPKVALSGSESVDFSVNVQPSSPVVSSENTTFQVTFNPSATGVRTATISIASNDSDDNPYTFSILGTGAAASDISKLAFTTSAQSITAGNVSAVMTIQTQNGSGAAQNVSGNTTVNLTSNSGTGVFYSDAAGINAIASVNITSGSNSASFYYRDTTAGTPTITAAESPSDNWTDATQQQTIVAADISSMVFRTASQNIAAGQVSGIMTIQTQDTYGNPSNVSSNTSANVTSSSGAGIFYSDAAGTNAIASVNITSGSNSVSFYYKDTEYATPTITVAENPSQGWTDATQQETIIDSTAPVTASVTTPSNGATYNASGAVPTTFGGSAADNAGGRGLSTNSTAFTLRRSSDNKYWDGDSWENGVTWLATSHSATSSGNTADWTSNVALPAWNPDTYSVQARATDKAANSFTGSAISFIYQIDTGNGGGGGEEPSPAPLSSPPPPEPTRPPVPAIPPLPRPPAPPVAAPPPPKPASFTVSNLSVSPGKVLVGESVLVSADVANAGETEGSYKVVLNIDGLVETIREVVLAGGQSTTLSFTVSRDSAKSYKVEIAGLEDGFETLSRPLKIAWWMVVLLLLIPFLLLLFWTRRRRKKKANRTEQDATAG